MKGNWEKMGKSGEGGFGNSVSEFPKRDEGLALALGKVPFLGEARYPLISPIRYDRAWIGHLLQQVQQVDKGTKASKSSNSG
jgi:hypothetical protein